MADKVLHEQFGTVINLFLNFHPKTRPILWRMLITQVYLYMALRDKIEDVEIHPSHNFKPLKLMGEEERMLFDWRTVKHEVTDDEVLRTPFKAAEN